MVIVLLAAFALFYVHQEIEIVKTSFLINKYRHQVTLLLDQYRYLVYNISQLESPGRVEDKLYGNKITLSMPKIENIRHFESVNLASGGEHPKKNTKESFLASMFDRFSTKAEAKVVSAH